jgi:hypothetical protein
VPIQHNRKLFQFLNWKATQAGLNRSAIPNRHRQMPVKPRRG